MWWRYLRICWIIFVLSWRCAVLAETTQQPTVILKSTSNGKIDPETLEIFSSGFAETVSNQKSSMEPTTIEIENVGLFEDTFGDDLDKRKTLETDEDLFMSDFKDSSTNIHEIFRNSNNSKAAREYVTAVEETTQNVDNLSKNLKSRHTTKRSIDPRNSNVTNPEKAVDPEGFLKFNNSLFLDMKSEASTNFVPKQSPLTGESTKDVVANELEKDETEDLVGGMTDKELLDIKKIPSENQVLEHQNVVTEISVQETINGQTFYRKPTKEELRIVENKILGTSLKDFEKDNDIFSRDNKDTIKLLQNSVDATINHTNSDTNVEDLASFLKTDSRFAEDDNSNLFGDWNNDGDDINDMESILKDDTDGFVQIRSDNHGENTEFDRNNGRQDYEKSMHNPESFMGKEPSSGDYRKFFHTERQNFSNVKEVKIMVSETEGDFFDDDDSISMTTPSVKENDALHETTNLKEYNNTSINKFDLIKEILDKNNEDNISSTLVRENPTTENEISKDVTTTITSVLMATELSFEDGDSKNKMLNPSIKNESFEISKSLDTRQENISVKPSTFTDNSDILSLKPNKITTRLFNGTHFKISSTETISTLKQLGATETPEVPSTKLPQLETVFLAPKMFVTEPAIVSDVDILAENGVSIQDLSEITSLVENSYHEISTANVQETTNQEANISINATNEPVIDQLLTELPDTTTTIKTTSILKVDKVEEMTKRTYAEIYTTENPDVQDNEGEKSTIQPLNEFSQDLTEYITTPNNNIFSTTEGLITIPVDISTVEIDSQEVSTFRPNKFVELVTTIVQVTSTTELTADFTENIHTTIDLQTNSDPTEEMATPPESTDTPTEASNISSTTTRTEITYKPNNTTENDEVKVTSNPIKDEEDKSEAHEITPSEVESMFNSKLEEYESLEVDDYDSKEHIDDTIKENNNEWTIFSNQEGVNENKTTEHTEVKSNSSSSEKEKQQLLANNYFEGYHLLASMEGDRHTVQMVPILRGRILNNSAEFTVKISKKDDTFCIPASAYIKEYKHIVNITWRANGIQNNSVALKIFENEEFYMIKEIMINIFIGNKFNMQQKSVVFNPDPVMDDTMPGRTRVVMMRDGTYVTFSNVEFLKKVKSSSNKNEKSEAAISNNKVWHFEIASICLATVVIIAIVFYFIAIKTKTKITLREKDELPQVTHC